MGGEPRFWGFGGLKTLLMVPGRQRRLPAAYSDAHTGLPRPCRFNLTVALPDLAEHAGTGSRGALTFALV